MTRSYPVLLGALAAIWGASYLFIKVAVDEIEPAPMMLVRLLLATALLVPFAVWREGWRPLAAAWRAGLVLGVINAAVPFTLIAWGEKHVDSGVAAVANATVPLFVALLAIRYKPSERASPARWAGIALGLIGVAVLTGGQPDVGVLAALGVGAVVLASLSYAGAGIYGQLRVERTSGAVLAAASMVGGALVLLPLGLWQAPPELPGAAALGSVAALAIGGTALGQLILFRVLRLHGAARLSLVTYLMPPIAILYGAVFLSEPLTPGLLLGLALILAGVALGSGAVRLPRRAAAAAVPRG